MDGCKERASWVTMNGGGRRREMGKGGGGGVGRGQIGGKEEVEDGWHSDE